MTDPKDSANPEPPTGPGSTVQQRGTGREPRLPHERDESADSQAEDAGDIEGVMKKAHDDLVAGRQDTSSAPELEAASERSKRTP